MNVSNSNPSQLLMATSVVASWLLRLLVAAWLLIALCLLVLHGWIVPRIDSYRGALEAQASKALGVPLRIGSIQARSEGLFPTIELRDVIIQDALSLPRVMASVSPRSLWRLGFEQLHVDHPVVEVRRDGQGRLRIGGIDFASADEGNSSGADWFFSQREFVVEHGTIRWVDERRGAPDLLLQDVRLVSRNSARRHQLRMDATPPPAWGDRLSLRGQFRRPLLSRHAGRWQDWRGQIYAELPRFDVTHLAQYVTLDARIKQGDGTLRTWIDIDAGRPVGGAADLALGRVNVVFDEGLGPLVLRHVTGRLTLRRSDEQLEFATHNLQFTTGTGTRWPGGNLWFHHRFAQPRSAESSRMRADRLDLGLLALMADRLPIGAEARRIIAARAPRGLVENIDISWQGPADAPQHYSASGQVARLSLSSSPHIAVGSSRPVPGIPGVRGLDARFEMTERGGKAVVHVANGGIDLPGLFEDPALPLDQLSGDLTWKQNADQIELELPNLQFSNADTEGSARLTWRTSDPKTSSSQSRFPGILDLQGVLTRANGTRVYRYLPLEIPKLTRDYVRDTVLAGRASEVSIRVRGNLWDVPFNDPQLGEFRIAGKVQDVHYAYSPPQEGRGPSRWPALTHASAELVFDRSSMQVNGVRARLASAPTIEIMHGEARIPDLSIVGAQLAVDARAHGPVADMLRTSAPLLPDMARDFVGGVQAGGSGDYRLKLQLPLNAMEKFKLQADLTLHDNELRLLPQMPPLTHAQGTLHFTENELSLAGVQGQWLGGGLRLEGRGRYTETSSDFNLRANGNMSSDGLKAAAEAHQLTRLAQQFDGSAPYTAALRLINGHPELSLSSNLEGMALNLPAPLSKAAATVLPLHISQKSQVLDRDESAHRENWQITLANIAAAQFIREAGGRSNTPLRGQVRIGAASTEPETLPPSGVQVNVALERLDADAWRQFMGPAASSAIPASRLDSAPMQMTIRAGELVVAGRTLHDVVMNGTREGAVWRANVNARELDGKVEYRAQQAGRLHARLVRLNIAAQAARDVESLLDEPPDDLPALDVIVDQLELMGRPLGRAEIVATNLGGVEHEWRLSKLVLSAPDSTFSAQGRWAQARGAAAQTPRETALNFKLDITDAGALLERLGTPGTLRRGTGRLEGEVQWRGSPFQIDAPSLSGQLHLNIASGQFLKVEPGIAKLLGVLSLQALPRRLTLDFRDVFSAGFAFDVIRGDARIQEGVLSTSNLEMSGINAVAVLDGWADIARETQNLHVVVVPETNAGTAALVATAIHPALGLGAFLAQMVLNRPLSEATTQEFRIDGTWADPRVTKLPRSTTQPAPTPSPKRSRGENAQPPSVPEAGP